MRDTAAGEEGEDLEGSLEASLPGMRGESQDGDQGLKVSLRYRKRGGEA